MRAREREVGEAGEACLMRGKRGGLPADASRHGMLCARGGGRKAQTQTHTHLDAAVEHAPALPLAGHELDDGLVTAVDQHDVGAAAGRAVADGRAAEGVARLGRAAAVGVLMIGGVLVMMMIMFKQNCFGASRARARAREHAHKHAPSAARRC